MISFHSSPPQNVPKCNLKNLKSISSNELPAGLKEDYKFSSIINADKTIKNGFTNLFDVHFEEDLK